VRCGLLRNGLLKPYVLRVSETVSRFPALQLLASQGQGLGKRASPTLAFIVIDDRQIISRES
jgi:hypothetical protein